MFCFDVPESQCYNQVNATFTGNELSVIAHVDGDIKGSSGGYCWVSHAYSGSPFYFG